MVVLTDLFLRLLLRYDSYKIPSKSLKILFVSTTYLPTNKLPYSPSIMKNAEKDAIS